MIKVAGTWEFGWSTPIMEYDLWHYPMREFCVDEWIMTPISGIEKKGIVEYPSMESILEDHADYTIVVVDEKGETELSDFKHPKRDVLYIFGKASYSPFVALKGYDFSVRMDTAINRGLMWPHQVATTLLYDRWNKLS